MSQQQLLNHRLRLRGFILCSFALMLSLSGCMSTIDQQPTRAVDAKALETQVAAKLSGTLTAKAPTPTSAPTTTPLPATPVPSPTPTQEPFISGAGPFLAFVRVMPEEPENIILRSGESTEMAITRFTGARSIGDLSWSADGAWLLFTSAHDYMRSQSNERNVYVLRPDGTGLRMLTGDYLDPAAAEGPFITLFGTVIGGEGECLVSAQGAASPVTTTITGKFELPGIPVTSRWVRALCSEIEIPRQGDALLAPDPEITNTVTITVNTSGQGWSTASLSPDACLLAGVTYRWSLNEKNERTVVTSAQIMSLAGKETIELSLPEGATITDVAWSPQGDQLVGTLTFEDKVSLWLWDKQGGSIGSLFDIPNPQDVLYSLSAPVWSSDGARIAFSIQSYYWWGDPTFKTEIDILEIASKTLTTVVTGDWGTHALHAAWSEGNDNIYYQLAHGEPGQDPLALTEWQVWSIPASGGEAHQVTTDGINLLPGVRSVYTTRTTPVPGCLEP